MTRPMIYHFPSPAHTALERVDCDDFSYRRSRAMTSILIALVCVGAVGCESKKTSSASTKLTPARTRIFAQGQIVPANGMIRLAATPGDTIEKIHVKSDVVVEADELLVTMRSLKMRQAQLESIEMRLQDAKQQQDMALSAAKLRVEAVESKLSQLESQRASLKRQDELLKLAKQQVTSAEEVLAKLKSIANDPLTRDFIGSIELDRQKASVSDAELKYRQEEEKLKQATESIEWSKSALNQELEMAKDAKRSAENSLALAAINSEKRSLELQSQSSILKSPSKARVIAINSRDGEAVAQFPVIELADESNLVCSVEVPETDASLIQPEQLATISSPALGKTTLHGKVLRRERIVGRPVLPPVDPLAISDYRSSKVIVAIDPSDMDKAAHWLQLQVSVEIQIDTSKPADSTGDAEKSSSPTQP